MPNDNGPDPLLLDTHCWVWLNTDEPRRLGEKARAVIREAASRDMLLVSVISVWEVAMLEAKGRLRMSGSCEVWVREALDLPGLRLAPLTPEIAIDSTRLPGEMRGDPADRILVATARRLGARLMTADRRLLDYGARHRFKVIHP